MTDGRTFNLTLEDAEFVVEELPWRDGFTQELRRWCEAERARQEEEQARAEERWERLAPAWNRLIWRTVTGQSV